MRALIKPAAGPGLKLVERPRPTVGPDDVLIRVERAGLCGTDLHLEQWDDWAASVVKPPLVIGHEFFGEVVRSAATSPRCRSARRPPARAMSCAGPAVTAGPDGATCASERPAWV